MTEAPIVVEEQETVVVDIEIKMVPYMRLLPCKCGRDRMAQLTPEMMAHVRGGGEVRDNCSCGRTVIGRRSLVLRAPNQPVPLC